MKFEDFKPNINIKSLAFLEGRWKGEGTASFPSINTTGYFDEIIFELDEDTQVISYRQKTWYNTDGVKGKTLHMESGYIKINESGACELSNSQSNGRTEVLNLLVMRPGNVKQLYFVSHLFLNDPRMIKSKRDFTIEHDIMKYEMKMATQKNTEVQTHLVSTLKKIND
jgi:hypothetical protein